ncbi:hypothetical protein ELQ35_21910 [Peribacillus cavernae]|uniref:Uncharacterized protein n=1 Tax=Peribacillus cavernae TaxID=1674310 RepID=A0A3S0TW05_9BACI|nr:hypothetical protein [Peribacillus cavernae]MDQ0219953.1 hypothetical protein [Peribacillus cavernae]RUQ24263.1 hypothetical protein ELQ35_21910 [Peribacillus cavernae]
MRGIALLNPHFSIGELSKKESLLIQKVILDKLVHEFEVDLVKLNPFQLDEYYTIPHALLYDLQIKKPAKLDCLLLYSFQTIERFQYIYPEKWEELSTCFSKIITLDTEEKPFYISPSLYS